MRKYLLISALMATLILPTAQGQLPPLPPLPPGPALPPPPAPDMPLPPPAAGRPPLDLTHFFRKTPYVTASLAVQRDVLRRAQAFLASRKLYNGAIDGVPGPATEAAIMRYQASRGLVQNGRLDTATLEDLHLLPGSKDMLPPAP